MLVLKDICFQYKKEIFKDANLRLNDSSLVCIHGKSGCGKTTLLKLLSFELPLQSGSISYMGNDINKDNLNNFLFQNVSYIDQEGLFLHNMTIFDHFEFYANLHNIAISTNIMNEYLQKVNLENIDLKKYPSYLSTGQRKRFLISLALMMNKSIMLLDEPTASLDTKNKELLLDVLKELSKTMLIICTSHDNQLIQKADSVYEIANLQFIEEKRGKSQENNFHVCKDKPSYIKYYKYKNLKIRFLFIVLFLVGVICINLISVSLSSNIALKAKINNQKASLQSNGLIYYKLPDARWLDFEEYDYIEPEDVAAIQKING
ncbi:MAG: ATP-binding cassette domain-containing protein, partial [Coprobacillus cateniformis]